MICCKIIADYDNPQGSFDKLCDLLGKKGDWKWSNGAMYFADVKGSTVERNVVQAIKKAGYKKYFIDIYDKDHAPRESEEENGWIANKVAKIVYQDFLNKNEQVLIQTKKGLDAIEDELNHMIEDAIKEASNKQSDTTEDSK